MEEWRDARGKNGKRQNSLESILVYPDPFLPPFAIASLRYVEGTSRRLHYARDYLNSTLHYIQLALASRDLSKMAERIHPSRSAPTSK